MTKAPLKSFWCLGAAAVFLLLGSTGYGNPTNIVQLGLTTAPGVFMQTGMTMILSLSSNLLGSVYPPTSGVTYYQWLKDGVPIDDETNAAYTNASLTMDDVGTYSVQISGNFNRVESEPVHLSVFFLYTNHSNGGVLSSPIGSFTFNSTPIACSSQQFDHWQCYLPFDGPLASPPSTVFPNTSSGTNLDISTCLTQNGTSLNTGIVIMKNVVSPPPPFPVVGCSAAAGSGCGMNSSLSVATVSLQTGAHYRVGIYYIGATAANLTKITFTWLYHN